MKLRKLINDPFKGYFEKLAKVESSNNPLAKSSTSSAAGLYQFTKGTWEELVKDLKLNYTLNDRFDPDKARIVVEEFTNRNKTFLKDILGREPNQAELYLAHFSGAGGASKLLSSLSKDPSIDVRNIFNSKQIKANKNVFLNKDGSYKTAQDIYNWAANKFGVDKNLKTNTKIKNTEVKEQVVVDVPKVAPPTTVREIPSLATPPIVADGLPTYTSLPEKIIEEEREKKKKGMTEQQVRQLLQAERSRMSRQTLANSFQQPQQQMNYAPQQPQGDLSYLYDYIDINNYADGGKYKVKKGDSLSKIARANNLSLSEILELNQAYRENPNLIKVGDTINLGRSSQPTVASAPKTTKPKSPLIGDDADVRAYLEKKFAGKDMRGFLPQQAKDNTRVKPVDINPKFNRFTEATDEFALENLDTPEKIKRVQNIMYYSGYLGDNKAKAVDGKLGPKTKKAIQDYQNAFLKTDLVSRKRKDIVDDAQNLVPLAARQYIYDTFGGDGELNETSLSDEDYDSLRTMVIDNLKNDKRVLNYEDYKRYLKTDKNVTTRGMGLGNSFSNLEKTLGAANIEVNEVGDIFVKDQYNWNDAGGEENRYKNKYRDDQGLLKVEKENSVGTNMYRMARNFKTKYGRREGGSPVKIFVGNVSEIF